MKTSLKIFAYAASMASIAFLACNDTGTNESLGDDNTANVSSSSENEPTHVTIADDVQKWMEEQLASNGDEKREIWISDMYMQDPYEELGLSTIGNNGKIMYFLNGKEISAEEYYRILEEARKNTPCRRDLEIPGIVLDPPGGACQNWTSIMTAEELAKFLSKKYDYLDIYFYIEPTNE